MRSVSWLVPDAELNRRICQAQRQTFENVQVTIS